MNESPALADRHAPKVGATLTVINRARPLNDGAMHGRRFYARAVFWARDGSQPHGKSEPVRLGRFVDIVVSHTCLQATGLSAQKVRATGYSSSLRQRSPEQDLGQER